MCKKLFIENCKKTLDIYNCIKTAKRDLENDDFYIILKSDVEKQLENAIKFLKAVREFIDKSSI